MSPPTIEQVLARIPMWQHARELQVSPLEGGITNHNYRIDVDGEAFVLRIPGDKTGLLGVHREHEYRTHYVAGKLGIAPEAIYFHKPEGYLVTRFVEGRPIALEELRQPENLQRVVEALHKTHSLPEIPGAFDVFQVVRDYTAIAQSHHVTFPENFAWLSQQMEQARSALGTLSPYPKPCHNDLLNANFLLAGEQLYILDWEYAGMGDIFFDLANFSSNHELAPEEDHLLLECYFGDVTPQDLAHLNIMKVMSDFREAMWALVQSGISTIDFHFRDYADKHVARLTQSMQNPNWNQWLGAIRQ